MTPVNIRSSILLIPFLFVLLSGAGIPGSSTQEEIKKRQAELQSIRDQIKEFEAKIREEQQNEHESLELLDNYDRKATLVRRLITKLRAVEQDLQTKITRTKKSVSTLEDQLTFLRDQYARHVIALYKGGRVHDLEILLSSSSINQFYVRNEYLKRFSAQRKRDADNIVAKKQELTEMQSELQSQLAEERRLIAEKGAEEDRVVALADERRKVITQIRRDKKLVQREIDRQMKAAKQLEDVIAQLIEEDRLRAAREAEEARKSRLPQPPPVSGTFASKKGKLPWPVAEGTVVAKFGNQRHPTLKTITQNLGIDIAVKQGTPVRCVADGEVTKILWLPSYGNLVILNHYDGYRTVYTHLSEILVAEGQKLKGGDIIAESGEALDGPRLHFEVWKDREKQNPELWLSRQ